MLKLLNPNEKESFKMFNIYWDEKTKQWMCYEDKTSMFHIAANLIVVCGASISVVEECLRVDTKSIKNYKRNVSPKALLDLAKTRIGVVDGVLRRDKIDEAAEVKTVDLLVFCPNGNIMCRLPVGYRIEEAA